MTRDRTRAVEMDLTISHAAPLHALLATWLGAGVDTLDLAAVTECDAAGVQLLCAAQHSARAIGLTLSLQHVGDAVAQALHTCGLDPQLRPMAACR